MNASPLSLRQRRRDSMRAGSPPEMQKPGSFRRSLLLRQLSRQRIAAVTHIPERICPAVVIHPLVDRRIVGSGEVILAAADRQAREITQQPGRVAQCERVRFLAMYYPFAA